MKKWKPYWKKKLITKDFTNKNNFTSEILIIEYKPEYAPAFKSLNVEWIEKYFTVEAHDLMELENPEAFILSKGGHILFAKYKNEIAGTCALIKNAPDEFYLAKWAFRLRSRGNKLVSYWELQPLKKQKYQAQKESGSNQTAHWCLL